MSSALPDDSLRLASTLPRNETNDMVSQSRGRVNSKRCHVRHHGALLDLHTDILQHLYCDRPPWIVRYPRTWTKHGLAALALICFAHSSESASAVCRVLVQNRHASMVFGSARVYDDAMQDITHILAKIERGDRQAMESLLPLVYQDLRNLARARMAKENPDHSLQATALVHEAYLRLVGSEPSQFWKSRGHFFAAAAEAMRRILVESARRKGRLRHGGGLAKVDLQSWVPAINSDPDELLDLDDALSRFAQIDQQSAELAKLRLFAGLTNDESAAALNIPPSTAKKHWLYARSWLRREITRGEM